MRLVSAVFLVAAVPGALAGPGSSTTKSACHDIGVALPGRVSYPLATAYSQEVHSYWSTSLRDIKPACLVLPKSAEQVAAAVRILNKYPDVRFAVKSGGHDPNAGHATVQDGVLISMKELTGTTYDDKRRLAHVQPGGEWNHVIGTLDPQGVAVAGGRLVSTQNIVGWETVTADGSIRYINATEEPDLAVAMRGSGSQFGIVTQFTIRTHPIGKIWGGSRIYDASKADQIFEALHNFIPQNVHEQKSAIIVSDVLFLGGANSLLVFYFHDGPEPPSSGPLAAFLKIPSLLDTTASQSYAKFLEANGRGVDLLNARISFRTFTIPYMAGEPAMYAEISSKFTALLRPYLANPLHPITQCSLDFQPLSRAIGQHSQSAGGNAMGISGSDPDRIIIEVQCSWTLASDDAILARVTRDLTEWLRSMVPRWLAEDPTAASYLPLFMNDASADQNVTGSYRDYARFRALQESVDPTGFFRNRGGGFVY
ncbi:hypothetical protein EsDP_00002886 [Epichloe bromicola]|uniref:FAD-binding PCMH-type domain-containing protein n=1 Tax=Epichloe bromicola TaxID=79588 RepID=A0ABQ0CM45_9HYPO